MLLTRRLQSGTGLITDEAKGLYATEKIWHDSRPEEIESLPDTTFHRNVDLPIVNADKEGVYSRLFLPFFRR